MLLALAAAARAAEEEEGGSNGQAGPLTVDHNGFMMGPNGSASLPEWQPNQAKQAQRLRKWRKMLGMVVFSWHA
jgi:hypothetical protein